MPLAQHDAIEAIRLPVRSARNVPQELHHLQQRKTKPKEHTSCGCLCWWNDIVVREDHGEKNSSQGGGKGERRMMKWRAGQDCIGYICHREWKISTVDSKKRRNDFRNVNASVRGPSASHV